MNKYRILFLALVAIVFAILVVARLTRVSAQQPAGSVKVTTTTVTRAILFKVNPGQRPAFDQDVIDNLIPIFEEEKKAGILTDYMFFNNVTADNPNDWNVGMTQTYARRLTISAIVPIRSRSSTMVRRRSSKQRRATGTRFEALYRIVCSARCTTLEARTVPVGG